MSLEYNAILTKLYIITHNKPLNVLHWKCYLDFVFRVCSLRTLCRTLRQAASNPYGNIPRCLYEVSTLPVYCLDKLWNQIKKIAVEGASSCKVRCFFSLYVFLYSHQLHVQFHVLIPKPYWDIHYSACQLSLYMCRLHCYCWQVNSGPD